MLRFDKTTYLLLLFKFILSVRLSNSLWGSDVPLLLQLINIVFILFYNFIEFIILLCTFLVIYFSWSKDYIIYLISFGKFSDVFPAFKLARAIGNLWSICLGVNILNPLPLCSLLKSSIFSTILTTFSRFSFPEISLLLKEFLKSINDLLRYSTTMSILFWLSSYKSLTKNEGDW